MSTNVKFLFGGIVEIVETITISLPNLVYLCQASPVGKLLPDALYVHTSALSVLPPALQSLEYSARQYAPSIYLLDKVFEAETIVKFYFKNTKISYLIYPNFNTDAHPILHRSVQVNWSTGQVKQYDYTQTNNPPILHRKETLVTSNYPHYETFAELTRYEEKLGLLAEPCVIGTLNNWQKRLKDFGVTIEGHRIIMNSHQKKNLSCDIQRHRAAIIRSSLSKPVRCALEAGLFQENTSFLDYGCGHGRDYQLIRQQGFVSTGWDPYYFPDNPIALSDIVNLGYVINVIEDPQERQETLLKAWSLTRKVLIVAAQVLIENVTQSQEQIAYGDGVITCRNTFQKYYEQQELKNYIDQVLSVDSIPIALGIYFVFRDETEAEKFRASRFSSRAKSPCIQRQVKRFSDYQELLSPLMSFMTERGRMPIKGELSSESQIIQEFGSLHRAFQVILQATNKKDWEKITEQKRDDLLLYLALTNFSHRPKFGELPTLMQTDIKSLFGTYRRGCQQADEVLYSLGNLSLVKEECQKSPVGKKSSKSLTVHITALENLNILLRLYEGCASRTIGRPQETTLITFYTDQPKISYLFVPNFDNDPHPVIQAQMEVDLRTLRVYYQDFDPDDNPPVLHRKDAFVLPNYPHYEKFAKLTHQEENWGLLENERMIRRWNEWQARLKECCATLQGHRVVWRKDCDPYKMRFIRSQIRLRKRQRHLSNSIM